MDLLTLFALAVGLSMDAFAVSICKGLSMRKVTLGGAATVGLWFGGFQALMPILGFFLGVQFKDIIADYDHWVAFGLLVLIGINMIREAFPKESAEQGCKECKKETKPLGFTNMLLMAVATSIDALAVGISFAFLDVDIWAAAAFIGITTFCFSVGGVKIGNVFGARHKSKAELAGGIILILIGAKVLFEHLMA